ncbi:MAG: hypothetical protein HY420_05180 [Candidatus Kerfeldbacteria bacterium]|nr:hypothetical protein [Candidatus Kerfeldbacteria bacterium]
MGRRKKWYVIIIGTLIFLGIIWAQYTFWLNNRWRSHRFDVARQALNNLYYGVSREGDAALEMMAEAQGWKLLGQSESGLLETKNEDAPILASIHMQFESPSNSEITHFLTRTFLFDDERYSWVPLITTSNELNTSNKKYEEYKKLKAYRMWQGDYDVPYFPPPLSLSDEEAKKFLQDVIDIRKNPK